MLGKQAAQAGFLECLLGLIDGGARHAKPGSHIDDRNSLHAVSAEHLVTDLKKILGIEEWILFEQTVGNRAGARVEGASPFQLQCFRIGLFQLGHLIVRLCKYYYASYIIPVKRNLQPKRSS